jgi:hypothetical protein
VRREPEHPDQHRRKRHHQPQERAPEELGEDGLPHVDIRA